MDLNGHMVDVVSLDGSVAMVRIAEELDFELLFSSLSQRFGYRGPVRTLHPLPGAAISHVGS